jgi:excisionase family DNA binding protein
MTTLLTTREAAELLHMAVDTARNEMASGRLRAAKIGGKWLTTHDAIDTYVAERMTRLRGVAPSNSLTRRRLKAT